MIITARSSASLLIKGAAHPPDQDGRVPPRRWPHPHSTRQQTPNLNQKKLTHKKYAQILAIHTQNVIVIVLLLQSMQLYYILYLCYISTYTTLSKVYIISLSHLNKMEYIHQHHPILHSFRLIWFVNSVLSSACHWPGWWKVLSPIRKKSWSGLKSGSRLLDSGRCIQLSSCSTKLTIFCTLICFYITKTNHWKIKKIMIYTAQQTFSDA